MNTVSSQNAEILKNEKDLQIVRAPLSRIFGVFFNQNQSPVLMNKEVREALNAAVDKDGIVNEVLNGYGIKINSPMPPELAANSTEPEEQKENADEKIKKASSLLEKGGWKMNAKDKVLEKRPRFQPNSFVSRFQQQIPPNSKKSRN